MQSTHMWACALYFSFASALTEEFFFAILVGAPLRGELALPGATAPVAVVSVQRLRFRSRDPTRGRPSYGSAIEQWGSFFTPRILPLHRYQVVIGAFLYHGYLSAYISAVCFPLQAR